MKRPGVYWPIGYIPYVSELSGAICADDDSNAVQEQIGHGHQLGTILCQVLAGPWVLHRLPLCEE